MFVQSFLLTFLCLSHLLPKCSSGTEPTPISGSFKTSLVSIKDCINTRRPYLKNPPMFYHPSIKNINGTNVLGGNLTVLKDTRNVELKFQTFAWRNGKWCLIHGINNVNCHGIISQITLSAAGVKYDRRNCMLLKGIYTFKNLDVNYMQHMWVPSISYGRLLWRVETWSKDRMLITCTEFDTVTAPARND